MMRDYWRFTHQILEVVAKETGQVLAARTVSVVSLVISCQSVVVALFALQPAAHHATAAPVRHEARPAVVRWRAMLLDTRVASF